MVFLVPSGRPGIRAEIAASGLRAAIESRASDPPGDARPRCPTTAARAALSISTRPEDA
jgi:hypothetical protein